MEHHTIVSYIRARDKRWAREDAERDAKRKIKTEQASVEVIEHLRAKWIRSDYTRIKHRVAKRIQDNRRLEVAKEKVDIHAHRKGEDAEIAKRYKKEDAKIAALHAKQDAALVERRKVEDVKRVARRKADEHLIYLKRCEQAVKLNERRREEDECLMMASVDGIDGLVRLDRLGSTPGTEC
jgi:hypothetical protein